MESAKDQFGAKGTARNKKGKVSEFLGFTAYDI